MNTDANSKRMKKRQFSEALVSALAYYCIRQLIVLIQMLPPEASAQRADVAYRLSRFRRPLRASPITKTYRQKNRVWRQSDNRKLTEK